jgi:SAM-dependent methyltransferase
VSVRDGLGEALPLENASVDAAVVSLVLCSVESQASALAELQRVLRPGGELRFYEHVRSERSALAGLQRAADVVWPYLAGGCPTHRDTPRADRGRGVCHQGLPSLQVRPCAFVAPVTPHVLGRGAGRLS